MFKLCYINLLIVIRKKCSIFIDRLLYFGDLTGGTRVHILMGMIYRWWLTARKHQLSELNAVFILTRKSSFILLRLLGWGGMPKYRVDRILPARRPLNYRVDRAKFIFREYPRTPEA